MVWVCSPIVFVEKSGIDGIVNGVGRSVQWGGRQLRLLQSGQVGSVCTVDGVGYFDIFCNHNYNP
jgi:hypothetical protein